MILLGWLKLLAYALILFPWFGIQKLIRLFKKK